MVPLLGALLDYDSDPETYARYDAMTSRELFRQYGETQQTRSLNVVESRAIPPTCDATFTPRPMRG